MPPLFSNNHDTNFANACSLLMSPALGGWTYSSSSGMLCPAEYVLSVYAIACSDCPCRIPVGSQIDILSAESYVPIPEPFGKFPWPEKAYGIHSKDLFLIADRNVYVLYSSMARDFADVFAVCRSR